MPTENRQPFAYLYERFPTFTQTFCYRECREMFVQGMNPAVYSVRKPADEPPQDYDPGFSERIHYLPEDEELTSLVKQWHSQKMIPRAMRHKLMDWPGKTDKHRVFAAAWAGPRLRRSGIRHVHVHFAGIAARTAYWLKQFYGISYSFTGHANDIFCEPDADIPVTLADLIREAAFIATVSEFSAQNLRSRFPDHAKKIHHAYNGISMEEWDGNKTEPSKFRIVSVGRFIEKKGFGDLIDACALLKKQDRGFSCEIIGEGPMQQELETKIQSCGLGESVTLAGPKSQHEIRKMMLNASVFALPCVVTQGGDMDNLPTVIMEAMATGLPCISTSVAGVPEMIENGQSGYIVPQRSPEMVAEAIASYIDAPGLAESHGHAAKKHAKDTFSLPTTTRHLKHLLLRHGRIRPTLAAIRHDQAALKSWLLP